MMILERIHNGIDSHFIVTGKAPHYIFIGREEERELKKEVERLRVSTEGSEDGNIYISGFRVMTVNQDKFFWVG